MATIGNYFELTTGQIITNNDSFNSTVNADNVVRHLLTAGKTWTAYEESLPKVGYTSPDAGNYVRRQCPKYSKARYKSSTLYQHQNTRRLMLEGIGVRSYPGNAKKAANMSEFFN